jgi:lipopolysaccharide/colanic/teichoic acid biosynthesis glycosyltransferase
MNNSVFESDEDASLKSNDLLRRVLGPGFNARIRHWMVRLAEGAGWLSFVEEGVVRDYLRAFATTQESHQIKRQTESKREVFASFNSGNGALIVKRAIDIVFAATTLALSVPLMLTIALSIWFDSPGPILYYSPRVGRGGRLIRVPKFRTMVCEPYRLKALAATLSQQSAPFFRLGTDPRITRVGRFLRKYSLDELPQLFNVLRGEMSLVGPRPPLASQVDGFQLPGYVLRLQPGITGLWQVQAYDDPSFARFVELNRAYADHWSLRLDFKILASTIIIVLTGRSVRIVKNSPEVAPRPKGFRREDFAISERDDEWVEVLATAKSA